MGHPAKKDELAKVESGGLQVSGLLMEQLGSLQTDGFENVEATDLLLPILSILQSISPQCDKKNKEAYDPDVSEGEFYNSVSKKSSAELQVIPIGFTKSYIEWAPRSSGGGFIARHSAESSRISQGQKVGNKLLTPEGNELVETREHYLMVLPEDGSSPYVALLPMKSTAVKHSKRFINEMTTKVIQTENGPVRAPMFAQKYTLGTGIESNNQGSWYALSSIKFDGFVNDQEFQAAKQAADNFNATVAKADRGFENLAPASTEATVDVVTDLMK